MTTCHSFCFAAFSIACPANSAFTSAGSTTLQLGPATPTSAVGDVTYSYSASVGGTPLQIIGNNFVSVAPPSVVLVTIEAMNGDGTTASCTYTVTVNSGKRKQSSCKIPLTITGPGLMVQKIERFCPVSLENSAWTLAI